MNFDSSAVIGWLQHWWPALVLALLFYRGLQALYRRSRDSRRPVTAHDFALHQVTTTLACTEAQAQALLRAYGGNTARAIQEVKTGKAVLPGSEFTDLATFGGDVKAIREGESSLEVLTHDGRTVALNREGEALLLVGVVDPEQRADSEGLGKANRGRTFAQLFWSCDGAWTRFLLDSGRLDYVGLGERKQNSAIRNFQLLIGDLAGSAPGLVVDESATRLLQELRAPLYKRLADFEAVASRRLRDLRQG